MPTDTDVSPFTLLCQVEKTFLEDLDVDNDLKQQDLYTTRIINLFKKSATLYVDFLPSPASESENPQEPSSPERLSTITIYLVPERDDNIVFNVKIETPERSANFLTQVRNSKDITPEASQIYKFLKAHVLLALKSKLPEGASLESDPEALLSQLNKTRKKKESSPKDSESKESTPNEETSAEPATSDA